MLEQTWETTMAGSTRNEARVYLTRASRIALARLEPGRQAALSAAFLRVGHALLERAEQVPVDPSWARRTWPRRRYPQQCYATAIRFVLDHPQITGMQLVHGVVAHAPRFVPFDHAWVELPGRVVFDGVVQAFFTHDSYYAVMLAVPLDRYSRRQTERQLAAHGHPGPWTTKWVPTPAQLRAFLAHRADVATAQDARGVSALSVNVGRKR
jgi:hypothetical protein